jgi:amino-acid N-acetyltransferase
MTAPIDTARVRPAIERDRDAVLALLQPFVDDRHILPLRRQELDELLPTSFIAEIDDRVIGFGALDIYSRKLAEIRSLVVADDCQGQGVGRRLVEACVALARERDVMEILAISSSESFFRSCGFDFTLPDEKKAFFLPIRTRQ